METEETREFLQERDNRFKTFRELFDRKKIDRLAESDFKRVVASLWMCMGWTNKEYVADRILKNISLDDLKSEFKNLLYGDEPSSKRYDWFFNKVRGIGPVGATEILASVRPT